MGLFSFKFPTKNINTPTYAQWQFVNNTWVTPKDKPDAYINGYKGLPNVYAIISLLTSKISTADWGIYKVVDERKYRKYKAQMKGKNYKDALKTKNQALEEVEKETDLHKLLSNPNELQSFQELLEAYAGYLLLTGNSYMFSDAPGMGLNATKPKELHVIPSPLVEIKAKNPFEVEGYKIYPMFNEMVDNEEVGHVKMFNPITSTDLLSDRLYGQSPLASCRNLLKRYGAADIAQGKSFDNMGIAGLLSADVNGHLNDEQAKAVQDNFAQFNTGTNSANKIKVTSANVKWTQLGLSPVDLNIIDGKSEILSELCNVYHVPQDIFSQTSSSYNNLNTSRKIMMNDGVIPVAERIKHIINHWLVPKFDSSLRFEFDYSVFDEMQEDLKEKYDVIGKMWELSPNQRLKEMGMPENDDPNMNKIYMPSGYSLLEDVASPIEDIDQSLLEDNDAVDN